MHVHLHLAERPTRERERKINLLSTVQHMVMDFRLYIYTTPFANRYICTYLSIVHVGCTVRTYPVGIGTLLVCTSRQAKRMATTLTELLTQRCCGNESDDCFLVNWSENAPHKRVTFRQFGARVHAAALKLEALGVSAGVCVGILAHNSVEFWVVSMAVVCQRAVCVLLNYRQPIGVLASMAGSAKVKRIIASGSLNRLAWQLMMRSKEIEAPILWINPTHSCSAASSQTDVSTGDWQLAASHSVGKIDFARSPAQPDEIAVVFFTSGSTSTPKPVAHSHASLLAARHEEDRWLR